MSRRRGALEPLLACLVVVATLGCKGCKGQESLLRSRFVEDGVGRDAVADWDGGSIVIDNTGVTPSGGLQLTAGGTDRVRAIARMLAIADTADKANADLAIEAAKKTFEVVIGGAITNVRCAHGTTFGTAPAQESGCDALDVSLPAGTDAKPLLVTARSGNGLVVASLRDAVVAMFDLHGRQGAIDVAVGSRTAAEITIVSDTGDDVVVRLPADFAADAIVLEAPAERIDTTAFPDLQRGKGRGEPGRGAKTITVRAGKIVLAKQ